jgi:8-oxo-dGTP pyrophosphatase MutT (NUDIX family)
MPKGVVREGEDADLAALREVSEETGFHCRIIRKLDAEAEYRTRDEHGTVWKRVILFLMEPIDEVRKPDGEMDTFRWVPLGKAREYAAENELPLIMEAVEAYKLLHPTDEKKSNSKPSLPRTP